MINGVMKVFNEEVREVVAERTGRANNCVIRMERKFCLRSY
jgi:hypothetical protein